MYQQNPLLESSSKDKKKEKLIKSGEALASAGAGLIGTGIVSAATTTPISSKFKKGNQRFAKFEELPDSIRNLKVNNKQNIVDYMKDNKLTYTNAASRAGAHFNPFNSNINLGIKDQHMDKWGKSLFAHEFGHSAALSKNGKPVMTKFTMYGVSKQLSSSAALAQLINCFNKDDDSRRKVGIAINAAGGVSAIPMIAEEIGASIRGTKMLGLKGADKAKAFVGIASYVVLALSPTIVYTVSETTRKFLRALRKAKKENPEVNQNINQLKSQDIKVKV